MTQYERRSFSVPSLGTTEYRRNWERVFGGLDDEGSCPECGKSCEMDETRGVAHCPDCMTNWDVEL